MAQETAQAAQAVQAAQEAQTVEAAQAIAAAPASSSPAVAAAAAAVPRPIQWLDEPGAPLLRFYNVAKGRPGLKREKHLRLRVGQVIWKQPGLARRSLTAC